MKIEQQSFEILTDISMNAEKELRLIELAGRTYNKSERGDFEKCKKFIRNLIKNGNESVLEHSILTVRFVTTRSVAHQIIRHRLCALSQESRRYCQGRFDNEISFIPPLGISKEEFEVWKRSCIKDESEYMQAIANGRVLESAWAILPNCTKTELVVSADYREWRHILKEHTSKRSDPNIKELMTKLLTHLYFMIPVIFEDFDFKEIVQ